ncbi:MAG: hypothetical protein AB8B73_16430 [Ekhidna sp.]
MTFLPIINLSVSPDFCRWPRKFFQTDNKSSSEKSSSFLSRIAEAFGASSSLFSTFFFLPKMLGVSLGAELVLGDSAGLTGSAVFSTVSVTFSVAVGVTFCSLAGL